MKKLTITITEREQLETQQRMLAWVNACNALWVEHSKENKMQTIKYINIPLAEGIYMDFMGLKGKLEDRKVLSDILLVKYRKPKQMEMEET